MANLLGSGRTAEVFAMDEGRVVKRFRDWVDARDIATELQIGLQLNHLKGLVPRCDGLSDASDGRGIVYERIDGCPLTRAIVERSSSLGRHAQVLARAHIRILRTKAPDLMTIHQRLQWAIDHASQLHEGERQALHHHLAGLESGDQLLHGDFHPENLLCGPGIEQPIDWTNASRGPALADVARTIIILKFARVPEGILPPLQLWISRAYTRIMARLYWRQLKVAFGVRRRDLLAWLVPVAAGRLSELPDCAEAREILGWLRRQSRRIL